MAKTLGCVIFFTCLVSAMMMGAKEDPAKQAGTKVTGGNNGLAYCSAYCANNWNSEMPSGWRGACCTSAVQENGKAISCRETSTSTISCTCARDDARPFLSSFINEDRSYTCEPRDDVIGECSQQTVGWTCFVRMGSDLPAKQGRCSPHSNSLPVDYWCDVGQAEPCTDKVYGDKCVFEGKDGVCAQHVGKTFCNLWPVQPTEKEYCVKHLGKTYCGTLVSASRPQSLRIVDFLGPLVMLWIISKQP